MYSVVIDIRKDTPQDVLQALEKVMDQAYIQRWRRSLWMLKSRHA